MDVDRKRLRQQYKESKPPMGCFAIRCTATGDMFIGWATNLESARNSLLFRLSIGGLLNEPALQSLYDLHGAEHCSFSVLGELSYDEGEDYQQDLVALTETYLENYPEAKEIQVWKYPQH